MRKHGWLVLPVGLVLLGVVLGWGIHPWWRTHRFDGIIRSAAARYQVDPALVKAVVWKESNFKPTAFGRAEEIGLMQIRELAAIEWAGAEQVPGFEMDHLFDAETNTLAGTWYLARLLKRYSHTDDPVPYALADYNAGRSNVRRWLDGAAATNAAVFREQIGFPSTREYVDSVVARRDRYRDDFNWGTRAAGAGG